MNFKDKYTTDAKEEKKTLLSNDAYAIGDMIEVLINKINKLISLK